MDHAEYLHQQILSLAPPGIDQTSRDLESGSDRTWYRVRVPDLRSLLKDWKTEYSDDLSFKDWLLVVDDLYQRPSIDERSFAGMIIASFPEFRRQVSLRQLNTWLNQLEGWKEVDNTCQSGYSAADLLADWERWKRFLQKLTKDKNINKRRASLVLLVKPLRTDHDAILDLALANVDALKHETHKLITKAVSWVLRSATKHHHAAIRKYMKANSNSLPAIAVRETQRKLKTGKK